MRDNGSTLKINITSSLLSSKLKERKLQFISEIKEKNILMKRTLLLLLKAKRSRELSKAKAVQMERSRVMEKLNSIIY